jgi:hypothetical protein
MNPRVSVKDFVPVQLVACKGAPESRESSLLSQFWPSANCTLLVHSYYLLIDSCFRRTLTSFMTDGPL